MTDRQQRITNLEKQGVSLGPQVRRDTAAMRRAADELRARAITASRNDLPGRDREEMFRRADALDLKANELEDRHLADKAENHHQAKLNKDAIPAG